MKVRLVIDGNPKLRNGLSKRMRKILSAVSKIARAGELDRERLAREIGIGQDSLSLAYAEFGRRGITKLLHFDTGEELSPAELEEVVRGFDEGRATVGAEG